jgi:hypothetical protein
MITSLSAARLAARSSRTILGTLIALGAVSLATSEARADSAPSPILPCNGIEYDLRAMMDTGESPADFDADGAGLDDGSVTISLPVFASVFPDGIPFFGMRTEIYANTNGNLTFDEAMYSFTPDAIPGLAQPTIAPYFGDVDFNEYEHEVPIGAWTMCVAPAEKRVLFTWRDVGYYSGGTDKRNSFQIAITNDDERCDDARNFALEYRYEKLEWTTGDASGGESGLGGVPAVAGLDSGDGETAVALDGSRTAAVLDLVSASNVGESGVFRFLITEDGLPQCGNGIVDTCEECDSGSGDGADAGGGACTDACQWAVLPDPCADGGGCDEHAECSTSDGDVVVCTCDDGYIGDGFACTFDVCGKANDPCDAHATCTDVLGAAMCSCNPGFVGDGFTCDDVDECESDEACGAHAACLNQPGGYFCTCDQGYRSVEGQCENIDECTEGNAQCSEHASCSDEDGSYLCQCDDGYVGDGFVCAVEPGTTSSSTSGTGGEDGAGGAGGAGGEDGEGGAGGAEGTGAGPGDPRPGDHVAKGPRAVPSKAPGIAHVEEGQGGDDAPDAAGPADVDGEGGADRPSEEDDASNPSGSGMCSASPLGGADPSALGTLLAVGAVIAARRRKS